jgi:AraC-like DNA-binding protein/GNAT superfamily N-acetyltransferase
MDGAHGAERHVGRFVPWNGGCLLVGRAGGVIPVHAHYAIQIAFGAAPGIRFRGDDGEAWAEYAGAVIASRQPHAMDATHVRPNAVLLVEPETREGRALAERFGHGGIAPIPEDALAEAGAGAVRRVARAARRARAGRGGAARGRRAGGGDAPSVAPDERILRAVAYVHAHLDAPLTLDAVAAEACLSPSRFRHLFVEQTGMALRPYILWRRMLRVWELTAAGGSLSSAAHEAGFADAAHLSRTSRRMFGFPPSSIRFTEPPRRRQPLRSSPPLPAGRSMAARPRERTRPRHPRGCRHALRRPPPPRPRAAAGAPAGSRRPARGRPDAMAALQGRDPREMARRLAGGHRAYVASRDGAPAAWGWVATRSADIGELGSAFEVPAGERYLWNFVTLPAHRGQGIYPRLLEAIVRAESREAERFWIAYAPENHASGAGIRKAGFVALAELSFDAAGARRCGGSRPGGARVRVARARPPRGAGRARPVLAVRPRGARGRVVRARALPLRLPGADVRLRGLTDGQPLVQAPGPPRAIVPPSPAPPAAPRTGVRPCPPRPPRRPSACSASTPSSSGAARRGSPWDASSPRAASTS